MPTTNPQINIPSQWFLTTEKLGCFFSKPSAEVGPSRWRISKTASLLAYLTKYFPGLRRKPYSWLYRRKKRTSLVFGGKKRRYVGTYGSTEKPESSTKKRRMLHNLSITVIYIISHMYDGMRNSLNTPGLWIDMSINLVYVAPVSGLVFSNHWMYKHRRSQIAEISIRCYLEEFIQHHST